MTMGGGPKVAHFGPPVGFSGNVDQHWQYFTDAVFRDGNLIQDMNILDMINFQCLTGSWFGLGMNYKLYQRPTRIFTADFQCFWRCFDSDDRWRVRRSNPAASSSGKFTILDCNNLDNPRAADKQ
jgi:hypothetical protein